MIFVKLPWQEKDEWVFLGTPERNTLGGFWYSERLGMWQAGILGGVFDAKLVCPD